MKFAVTSGVAFFVSLCAIIRVESQGLPVTITLDSLGPPHQAATWIELDCLAATVNPVQYNWTFYCTQDQPLDQATPRGSIDDTDSIRLRSTPSVCINTVVCRAQDLTTRIVGEGVWTVGIVTGIGLWGTEPIASNSAYEADADGQIGRIFCHSSSNQRNVGHWFGPDGQDLTNDVLDIFSVQFFSAENHLSYSTLEVLGNHQVTATHQGAYTCEAPDNEGVNQHATVWILPYSISPRNLRLGFTGRTSTNPFTLRCDTTDLPGTIVQWRRGSSTLTTTVTYRISQSHPSNYSLNFTTQLIVDQPLHLLNDIYSCAIFSFLHRPQAAAQGVRVTQFFGVYSLGAIATITCNVADPSAALIQWETLSGLTVGNSTQLNVIVEDAIHHLTLLCRGYNVFGVIVSQLIFKFVVNVPETILTAVTDTSTPSPTVGLPYTIQCRAALNDDPSVLSSAPIPSFHHEDGSNVQNGAGISVSSVTQLTQTVWEVQLQFDYLKTSHAGRYVCKAQLNSPALDSALIREDSVQVNLRVPTPSNVILSSSHLSPYYAGGRLTLTCTATASTLVDTDITAIFVWTKSGQTLSASNRVTITYDRIGQTGYSSMLTTEQLHHEEDNGMYQCTVFFEPSGGATHYLTDSGSASSSLVNISVNVQPLQMSISPAEQTVLDIPPHNTVTMTCTATDVDGTTVGAKQFSWRRKTVGSSSSVELVHGVGSVTITNQNLNALTSSSVLETSEVTAGTHQYTCVSAIFDETILLASGNTTSLVRVNGPANPVQATSISALVLTFSTARIQWTVPSIAYTQETYTVLYREQGSAQDLTSSTVAGSTDLNAQNRVYTVTLTGLEEGTMYAYRIQSTNTIGRITHSPQLTLIIANSPVISSLSAADPSATPFAGQTFALVCEAIEHEGTVSAPSITWLDEQDQAIMTNLQQGISISSTVWNGTYIMSTLTFQPLTVSLSQEYTCNIDFSQADLLKMHTYNLQVVALSIPVWILTSTSDHQASNPLTLTCEVDTSQTSDDQTSPIGDTLFVWSSDCTGDCFVSNQQTQSVSTPALRSRDSGCSTCTITDSVGNSGNSTYCFTVAGVGLYSNIYGSLSNNSYIVIGNAGLGTLHCLSGSTQADVGQWIAPSGDNLTFSGTDHPFRITTGDTRNPGSLEISLIPGERFSSSDLLGVYSCRIPDETDTERILHIGIHTSTPPSVTIQSVMAVPTSTFTLRCTSTSSVASAVQWYKNNQSISSDLFYDTVQILRDGVTSTYDNLLLVFGLPINELPGDYRCGVSNDVSTSPSVEVANIQGLTIHSHNMFELGSTAQISCSSDLGVTLVEWLHNRVLVHGEEGNEAVLTIENVLDTDHDKVYTCTASADFGMQESDFTLQVHAAAEDLSITITQSPTPPVANLPFSLMCTVTKDPGLTNTPTVEWIAMGNKLTSENLPSGVSIEIEASGLTVVSTLSFESLNHTHSGDFECVTEIITPAIPGVIRHTADWTLIVPDVNETSPPNADHPCTRMFQLLLSEVQDCQEYRFTDQASKIDSIISSIVENVNRIGFTICSTCHPLNVADFTEPTFDCDSNKPTSVLFRVMLALNGTCDEFVLALTDWVKSGSASVTVNFNTLRVNNYCEVEIDSANAPFPECDDLNTATEATVSLPIIAGGAAGAGVFAVLILVIVLIACVVCCLRRRKKKRFEIPPIHHEHPHTFTDSMRSTNTYSFSNLPPASYVTPLRNLPPVPEGKANRQSGDSYIYMRPGNKGVTEDLVEEVYDEIPAQFYEEVCQSPMAAGAGEATVTTFK